MTVKTVSAGQDQKKHLFQKGTSGNPKGKPVGAKNKATIAALTLLEGEAEALTRKAVDMALQGDIQALRICLERIVSPAKERPISINLPKVETAEDLPKITAALLSAVGFGEIGPTEASTLAKLVEVHRGALEIADITERIKRLEKEVKK